MIYKTELYNISEYKDLPDDILKHLFNNYVRLEVWKEIYFKLNIVLCEKLYIISKIKFKNNSIIHLCKKHIIENKYIEFHFCKYKNFYPTFIFCKIKN